MASLLFLRRSQQSVLQLYCIRQCRPFYRIPVSHRQGSICWAPSTGSSSKGSNYSTISTKAFCSTCQSLPEDKITLPSDLAIDTTSKLLGNISRHAVNLLIHTGRHDWTKTIEAEEGSLAAATKALVGRGGQYADPFNNILIHNVSLSIAPFNNKNEGEKAIQGYSPSRTPYNGVSYSSATIAPLGLYLPYIPHNEPKILENLVRGFLQPVQHDQPDLQLSMEHRHDFEREVERMFGLSKGEAVHDVSDQFLILICGHNQRDQRCGMFGPVLENAFNRALKTEQYGMKDYRVGLISHIGGHKFAGNVILYLPRSHALTAVLRGTSKESREAGTSVWYGRVTPEHVPGLLKETIGKSVIVKDLLRGITDTNGEVYDASNL